ncbi:hypothetical protein SGL43_02032 [Streptomyces globisporus]|uniref:Uncharacterized protein n=1 Tax=Streptomyces globisporus TaxID=1908 RepID=A0ABM9GU56_STRGL|nr:hypothetical protein SGL43_02032 [Streptomyces globisporus]
MNRERRPLSAALFMCWVSEQVSGGEGGDGRRGWASGPDGQYAWRHTFTP